MEFVKFANDDAKEKFGKIYNTGGTNKGLYKTDIVPISEDFAVSFKEPSIYNMVFEIAALDQSCLEIKGSMISDELYDKFSNIVRKKGGVGVVPVHGQVCMGCDMVLPVQFVIDLRMKQEHNEIDYCPYCSRIIWYEELDPETEKSYIFEQLESKGTGSESKASAASAESQQDTDSYDESMGMDGGFEDF